MDKISSVWAELQKSNRLPSGALMSSCQSELQELMYQLDVMLSTKKQQWTQETEELQARLLTKERELRLQQTALEIKTREMEDLKNQMEGLNKAQKSIVDEYEDHLSKLRSEVFKVRKEYEKLHKQHQRYKKDLQKKKEQVMDEKKESDEEIRRLKERLEEYESKERDWEIKLRGKQHDVDMLSAQKRTLTEKCDFLQQQAKTYQAQIGHRRDISNSADDAFAARMTQLESNVDRSTKTIVAQKEKIDKLKGSLDDAMASHKKTMSDNEKLLDDLQKANETIQMLEERIAELEDQLRTAREESHSYSQNISRMEHTLNAKDNIIKHMGVTQDVEDSDQVKRLKEALQNAREDLKLLDRSVPILKSPRTAPPLSPRSVPLLTPRSFACLTPRSQKQMLVQLRQSPSPRSGASASPKDRDTEQFRLSPATHTVPSATNHSKASTLPEDINNEKAGREQTPEVRRLQLEVNKLQDKLAVVNETHTTELTAMRQKLASLTTELHQRNTSLASLSEKSCELERSMRDESDVLDKKVSELKAAQNQIKSLEVANEQLRHELMFQSDQDYLLNHSWNNTQSHQMRREMNTLRNSVEDVEQIIRSQQNSARTDTSRLSDKHSGSAGGNTESSSTERFSVMDDYLDTSIRRYDEQLQFLEAQKARLESQMSQGSRQNLRIVAEERKLHEAGRRGNSHYSYNPDDSQGSEPMSFVSERQYPKVDRLELPHSSSEDELPDMAEEAPKAFFDQEHQHAHELERRLNAQISGFTHGLDH